MEGLKLINIGVRFLLEIFVLIILGYWGFKFSQGTILKFIVGIGLPLLIAVIWGLFGAPKATYLLSGFPFLLLEIVVFGLPVIALLSLEEQALAFIYGLITVINLVLMKIWDQ
ncbi:YrdB family protein [Bacillus sp. sid0103]|uniref:YrdB family protein n=1 Tax=Bacillus sp. sid0103 TaxID=2856337 RepID=UPI001C46033B|nr:YrdB family protein [Bacillus sp. sid0103]MBV7506291.1 YrdB family protein [Bacillus sp. sid0103]